MYRVCKCCPLKLDFEERMLTRSNDDVDDYNFEWTELEKAQWSQVKLNGVDGWMTWHKKGNRWVTAFYKLDSCAGLIISKSHNFRWHRWENPPILATMASSASKIPKGA